MHKYTQKKQTKYCHLIRGKHMRVKTPKAKKKLCSYKAQLYECSPT